MGDNDDEEDMSMLQAALLQTIPIISRIQSEKIEAYKNAQSMLLNFNLEEESVVVNAPDNGEAETDQKFCGKKH